MAQYIPHPALMGAQEGNQIASQRMNLVGQAIRDFANARNAAAAADYQAEMEALKGIQGLSMPTRLADGTATPGLTGQAYNDALEGYKNIMNLITARKAARTGVNYNTGERTGSQMPGPMGTPLIDFPALGLNISGALSTPSAISTFYGQAPYENAAKEFANQQAQQLLNTPPQPRR